MPYEPHSANKGIQLRDPASDMVNLLGSGSIAQGKSAELATFGKSQDLIRGVSDFNCRPQASYPAPH